MRAFVLLGVALLPLTLGGCYSRTVETRTVEPTPVMTPQPQSTVVVPPGSTVVCPAGQSC